MKKIFLMAAFAGLLGSAAIAGSFGDDKGKKSKKECAKSEKSCAGEKKEGCDKGKKSCCKKKASTAQATEAKDSSKK